ncbi:flagellar motor switch protein FliG [Ectobacillus ponti]|uniref:Flagellar motor switch protein FliG n=1 Tax=Ectobacillus ponti TaxID=2961894 RepID=A0AA42BSV2_9BACI|nr:flagellar motor switch protein FliG [Ectobacillus ponti]MCP8968833.1 flagellar motor switch protein FliG [Ectobacillus ponti]
MNIFVCGSSHLSAADQTEIEQFLLRYAPKHQVHVLSYKNIEREVLRFFVQRDHLAPQLHMYSLQPIHTLSPSFQSIVHYLEEQGARYVSFGYAHSSIYRSEYITYLRSVLLGIELVVCFYNGDSHTSVIPVDVAKEMGIDAVIYELPGENAGETHRRLADKLRVIQ